jgi:serine/threonine protein kinase/Flp pilus assembly protein TadD
MEPERWERLWTVFHGALERPAGEARAAFLEQICAGDAVLRREAESLIAAHEDAAGALDSPLAAAALAAAELAPGSSLGPYRIERRLGEGGMGIVYEAQQFEPVRRRVALKLVKLGMNTREVVLRFEAERQALARMEHGSIARVFDAGATPDGRPYFVMERVDGPAITAYCDGERLTLARRLELFVAVCRAVHHAHQKGIIHRDLKASNVLVATEEGRPVPKVIDFGIARAVATPGGATQFTRLGQLIGTPETMSPEQAASSSDVDTRTDIYSLGALLYELACGAPPFELAVVDLTEALRRVREEEPPSPSTRYARLARPAADAIAGRRATDRSRLARELAGELDWIVGKAMAKERERRYASAAALADDLERHLAHRPVAAGPPGALYRLGKLVRRHRVETAAAAALLVALVAFGLAMAVQARRLSRALEVQERERATANRVSELLSELLEQSDPAVARGTEPTLREVLDRGAAKVAGELGAEPEIQARLLETIGRVYLNLGRVEAAEPALLRALELRRAIHGPRHEAVAAALFKLGELEVDRARFEAARARAEESLEMRRALLGEEHPAVAESLDLLGQILRQTGDLRRAEALHQRALEIRRKSLPPGDPAIAEGLNYLGIARRWRGDLVGAEAAYRQALEIWRRALGPDHPRVAMAMNNLALTVHVRGDYAAAERLFAELIPLRRRLLGPTHPDFLVTLANYGKLLHDRRELEAAVAVYEEALAAAPQAYGEVHPQIATMLADSGRILAKLGRGEEALARVERALAMRRKIFGGEHTSVAAALSYRAEIRAARGERQAAARDFAESVALFRRTAGEEPRTAEALEAAALFALAAADLPAAEAGLREALAIYRARLPAADRRIARAESALGECLLRADRRAEAEALLVASLAALADPENPDTADARARLAALRGGA